jgi:hypothetical protein
MQATLAATANRRKISRSTDEHHPPPMKRHDRWSVAGKVTLAIVSIGISLAALTLTNADSHLTFVSSKSPQFSGDTVSGQSYIFKLVVFGTFLNAGLRSDFVDHIEIHPVKFDQALKSEPIFVDKQVIGWREKKDLRFEVLVTTKFSFDWQDFLITFYDSKGRKVGEMPIGSRFTYPGKGRPPIVVSTHLTITVPERFRDPQRRFFAWFKNASGEVEAQSNPEGELENDGHVDLAMKFLNPVYHPSRSFSVLAVPVTPPGITIPMTMYGVWSDGSRREQPYLLTTTTDGRAVAMMQPTNPVDGSPKAPTQHTW